MAGHVRTSACKRHTVLKIMLLATVALFSQSAAMAAPASRAFQPLPPECEKPAPIYGKWNPETPGYLIGYKDTIKSYKQATRALTNTYKLKVEKDFPAIKLFYVKELSHQQLAALRCEPAISYLEHDSMVGITPQP